MSKISVITDPDYFPDQMGCFGISHRFAGEYASDRVDNDTVEFVTPSEVLDRSEVVTRAIDRTLHFDATVQAMHGKLGEDGVLYLNHPSVMGILASKVGLYDALDGLEEYLIPTVVVSDASDLRDYFCSKVGRKLVVKPEYGGMGNRVFLVQILSSNQLHAEWIDGDLRVFEGDVGEFYEQYMCGENTKHDRKNALAAPKWVVQDFIEFSHVKGGVVDIRLIHQATPAGTKHQSALYGRRAAGALAITNLEKGGQIVSIDEVLREARVSVDAVLELCREVERVLEASTGHIIGEIGHDVGIAKSGQLFYIEGNTMPGYVYSDWDRVSMDPSFSFSSLPELDQRLISTPLDYLWGLE